MEKVIVATRNEGKLKEIRDILNRFHVEVLSMEEAGFYDNIEETGNTFEENAMVKAKVIQKKTGAIVIADDSGLVVDALDGAPGIYSARFGGEHGNDQKNNDKLLMVMNNVPDERRSARFVCAIAVVYGDDNDFVVKGTVEGVIGRVAAGKNGFGYDPLFYLPQYGKTMAQLEPSEKNMISHRGEALRKMVAEWSKRKSQG